MTSFNILLFISFLSSGLISFFVHWPAFLSLGFPWLHTFLLPLASSTFPLHWYRVLSFLASPSLHWFPPFAVGFLAPLFLSAGFLHSSPNLLRALGADKAYLMFGVSLPPPSVLLALEHLLPGQGGWGQQIHSGELFVYWGFDLILISDTETHTHSYSRVTSSSIRRFHCIFSAELINSCGIWGELIASIDSFRVLIRYDQRLHACHEQWLCRVCHRGASDAFSFLQGKMIPCYTFKSILMMWKGDSHVKVFRFHSKSMIV